MTLDKLKAILKTIILIILLVITINNKDIETIRMVLKMLVADLLS